MTKKITTPNGQNHKRGPIAYHDMRELIQALMDKPLSPQEMIQIQNKYETNFEWKMTTFENLLQYLGNTEPVYEYAFRRYKILTQKDIEQYREELKNNHGK